MSSIRMSPNQREVLSAISTITGQQEYLKSTNGSLNITGGGSGGGIQYQEGDIAATPTGTAVVFFDGSNSANIVNSNNPLPVQSSGGTVSISDVIPGTGGLNLGKAEDQAHGTGDVGVMALGVRQAVPGNLSDADGDYEPFQVSGGRLWVDASGTTVTVSGSVTANAGTNLNTSALSTSANQTNGTQQTKITDGTNVVGVLKADGTIASTQNAQIVSGTGMTTATLTLNAGSPATAWFDMLNYAWVSVEILTNTTPATLTWQTSGDAAQTNTTGMYLQSGNSAPALTTTSATATFSGPRAGRYFRVSSNVAGGNTVTLVITLFSMPATFPVVQSAQNGTWTVGSNSATASAVPANAFYVAGNGSTGNLTGLRMSDFGDGQTAGILAAGGWLYNGASQDKARANEAVSLLASAARTTTQTSADLLNYNGLSNLDVILDVTSAGTGSITLTINGKDPASGKYYLLLSGAVVVSNSTNRYSVSPYIAAVANVRAQDVVPRIFQVVVTANNANSMTYSVGYNLSRDT